MSSWSGYRSPANSDLLSPITSWTGYKSPTTSDLLLPCYAENLATRMAEESSQSTSESSSTHERFDPRARIFLDVSASESEDEFIP